MIGALPELVETPKHLSITGPWSFKGKEIYIWMKGRHRRESSAEWAFLDHIVAYWGRGDWVTLRPVLDEWPRRVWSGVDVTAG